MPWQVKDGLSIGQARGLAGDPAQLSASRNKS